MKRNIFWILPALLSICLCNCSDPGSIKQDNAAISASEPASSLPAGMEAALQKVKARENAVAGTGVNSRAGTGSVELGLSKDYGYFIFNVTLHLPADTSSARIYYYRNGVYYDDDSYFGTIIDPLPGQVKSYYRQRPASYQFPNIKARGGSYQLQVNYYHGPYSIMDTAWSNVTPPVISNVTYNYYSARGWSNTAYDGDTPLYQDDKVADYSNSLMGLVIYLPSDISSRAGIQYMAQWDDGSWSSWYYNGQTVWNGNRSMRDIKIGLTNVRYPNIFTVRYRIYTVNGFSGWKKDNEIFGNDLDIKGMQIMIIC